MHHALVVVQEKQHPLVHADGVNGVKAHRQQLSHRRSQTPMYRTVSVNCQVRKAASIPWSFYVCFHCGPGAVTKDSKIAALASRLGFVVLDANRGLAELAAVELLQYETGCNLFFGHLSAADRERLDRCVTRIMTGEWGFCVGMPALLVVHDSRTDFSRVKLNTANTAGGAVLEGLVPSGLVDGFSLETNLTHAALK
jgi:hypothetical protein